MTPLLVDVRQPAFWDGIAGHSFGSLFSSPQWTEAVARTYGFTISASARSFRGTTDAAILFCHVSDLRGDRVVCGPFSDYCDPLVTDAKTWHDLITPLLALRVPIMLRCLHNNLPAADARFKTTGRAAWHALDLARSEEEIWAGLSGSARQNVRNAKRNGLAVREGRTLEDVRIFRAMHGHVRKSKYRLLAQPLAFFEQLHACFAPAGGLTVLLAEAEGVPIAGVLYLEWGNALYYKFNASVAREHCPNDLLIWEGIRMGRRHGLSRLDFGLSDLQQPGLLRFKRKFATEEKAILRLRWQPQDYSDRCGQQTDRLLGRMTELFTDPSVPDEITRAAGDEFYGLFC